MCRGGLDFVFSGRELASPLSFSDCLLESRGSVYTLRKSSVFAHLAHS